jgi:hypothetical protein
LLLVAIVVIKALLLLADPTPSFYFGDSGVYLTTAIGKWIPPNHSFVYGLLLRPLAVWPRSLEPVVIFQAGLSAVASWAVALCLVRYLGTSFLVGAVGSLLCAIEPLQLMSERYILPETVGTFLFTMVMLSAFNYLKTGSLSLLVFIQILSVVLVSLEVGYLPVVLANSVLLPLLSRRAMKFWKSTLRVLRTSCRRVNGLNGLRFVVLPLVISVVFSQALLLAYRSLHGSLLERPPAYVYQDGFSMAGVLAPIIKPEDYPLPQKRAEVFSALRYPLGDPKNRSAQRWMQGGLCQAILHSTQTNELEANRLAKVAATHAAKRDPGGVLRLAAFTFGEYFEWSVFESSLKVDEGQYVHSLPREAQMLKTVFGIDVEQRTFDSLTKRWQRASVPWCWFVLLMPFVFLTWIAFHWGKANSSWVLCLWVSFILLGEAIIGVDNPTSRDLNALAWMTFLTAGVVSDQILVRTRKRRYKVLKADAV